MCEVNNLSKLVQGIKPVSPCMNRAGGILYNPIDQCVLVVRGREKWSFPKGHREVGEALHETAIREIYEETSLKVPLTPQWNHIKIMKCMYYLVTVSSKISDLIPPDQREILEIRWCTRSQLRSLDGNKQLKYFHRNWERIIQKLNI